MPLHDLVGAGAAQPEGKPRVTHVVRRHPVDHGPLVQAEAAELGWAAQGGGEEAPHEVHGGASGGEQVLQVECDTPVTHLVVPPGGPRLAGGALEQHPRPRVPAPQPGRGVVVVGEEEVLDRVRRARATSGPVR